MWWSRLRLALRITLLYILFGGIWILLSDRLLATLVTDVVALTALQTYKGWAFVLISALLLFALLRREGAKRRWAREAEATLRARLSGILDSISDAFVTLDKDWRITYANPSAARINQKPTEEFLGKIHWEEWPAALGTPLEANFRRAMTERIAVHFEHRYYVEGQYDVWLDIRAYPYEDGLALFYHDISKRKQAEGQLRRLNSELEERVIARTDELNAAMLQAQAADRLKSTFLATMSHELRTPLNSIIGFAGVLLQEMAGPLNPEQAKQLGMVRTSARHLLALINDVLDISKIEAGQLEIAPAPFDMRAAIETALQSVGSAAQRKGLALGVSIESGVGQVVSDRRRVEQILLNLLSNAVKFTQRGEVRLECRVQGEWLAVSVHDTGIGIRPEDLARLFQPFQQVESGLTRRHDGTGLGLSICKNLVRLLGGEIWAESEWGVGSTFTFTLPLARMGE